MTSKKTDKDKSNCKRRFSTAPVFAQGGEIGYGKCWFEEDRQRQRQIPVGWALYSPTLRDEAAKDGAPDQLGRGWGGQTTATADSCGLGFVQSHPSR